MDINSASRICEIRDRIQKKPGLNLLYRETYQKYKDCLGRCPPDGIILELGSGGGFIKDFLPEAVTSDLVAYEGVDQIVDACRMPFPDQSLRAIFLCNVFHHIADAEAFFKECTRCLKPGGHVLITDPYCGWFASFIYRYLHHEPIDPNVLAWRFESSGPLSDANIALAGIVFERDLKIFKTKFSNLEVVRYEPNTPLRYWLCGGLKFWSLLPGFAFPFASWLDRWLVKISTGFASFVDIELRNNSK